MITYIGVDPGASGGLVALSDKGKLLEATRMPGTERDIWDWFMKYRKAAKEGTCTATIEFINPGFSGVAKGSLAKLYGSYKALRMCLTAAYIPFDEIKPRLWQEEMGIAQRGKSEPTTKWKNRLKARAQQLFPQLKVTLATADALMISAYGRRKSEGKLRHTGKQR